MFTLHVQGADVRLVGTAPLGADNRPSIAVLPFRKYQKDPEEAYFADGIVDDIIYALAGLKELFVVSRGSTLGYGGDEVDARAIGQALGVRYVLYGSVRRDAGRLRIATELSDAETGTIIRSDKYEGELERSVHAPGPHFGQRGRHDRAACAGARIGPRSAQTSTEHDRLRLSASGAGSTLPDG